MKTAHLFKNKTVLSFEIFPPKRDTSLETVNQTLEALRDLAPDFISVTYSASGSANSAATVAIAAKIQNEQRIDSAAHLSCIHRTKDEVLTYLEQLKANNIQNILALLGDPQLGVAVQKDFRHASDLVAFIREHGDFNILAACYPEGHIAAPSLEADIRNLKIKVDSGADQLVTQLFFDNQFFYAFRERAAKIGIHVPIEAGIMPVISRGQIERMVALCGVSLPARLTDMMARYDNHPADLLEAGIDYAVRQIVDLIEHGADGIHLYTMNNATVARKISEAVQSRIISRR